MSVKELVMVVTATFPANLPANNKVYASMLLDPAIGAVSQLTVPLNEAWVIDDTYVTASQTPDAILEFKKNLVDSLLRSSPVNSLLVSNPSRPRHEKKVLAGGDILTIEAQNLAAVGASAQTITCYVRVLRFLS